jgi:hypothetical protein
MADLNETEAARVALDQVWRELAAYVADAKQLQSEATRHPSQLSDPWVEALVSWFSIFDRELAAVQAVYEADHGGARLSAEELSSAREAGKKLLEIISETQERVPHTS